MKRLPQLRCWLGVSALVSAGLHAGWSADSHSSRITNAVVLSIENRVEVVRFGSQKWDPAYVRPTHEILDPGDRLRTGLDSRALLRLSNLTDFPVGELTQLEIPRENKERAIVRVLNGIIYFFHRDRPGEFQVDTPIVSAVVRGTEFSLEVAAGDGTSTFRVFDGELELSNQFGNLRLLRGQEGVAAPGQPPVRTAVIMTSLPDTIQWCLYYPGTLYLDELSLSADEQRDLAMSLDAYRSGDLVAALTNYPAGRQPASDHEKIYRAAVLLAVGKVSESEKLITALTDPAAISLGQALQTVIAAVKFPGQPSTLNLQLSTNFGTAWLAESYAQQSQFHLEAALGAARRATEIAPDFAFAWTHLAELEFGFGRTKEALAALEKSLRLAPRNAQSLALKGFLLAARNRTAAAIEVFDQAIHVDGALGNAWLGRGLCRIRQGEADAGRQDLLVAATFEPQRAFLRSYLGKAFADAGDFPHARKELELAGQLDPNDPTSWLYSALFNQEQHRFNEGIRDLEKSLELNDNRQLYRSRFLLDEDRSVRSSSLATIYRDNGMTDVSVREAASAVSRDYANYSAHLFLANSLDALRDPTRFNLRYETAWFNELLLANLLAPVGAGVFSQNISQQEYSRLFDVRKFGLATTTDIRSDGQRREVVSQFGNFDRFSYSLDLDAQHNDGVRPNNGLDRIEWYSQFKFQLTPADTLFLLTKYQDYHSGDNFQYYDWRTSVRTNFTFDEDQKPIAVGAYHHEWSPGVHTLLLGGRLVNMQHVTDRAVPELLVFTSAGQLSSAAQEAFDVDYHSKFEAGTFELNQIFHGERQTLVAGSRFQDGQFTTRNELNVSNASLTNVFYLSPAASTNVTTDFQRVTAYAYYTLEPLEHLRLTAGAAYDHVQFPENWRVPPISAGDTHRDLLGPKAALIYDPAEWITFRGVWTRSLGGVTLDESYRLEPTQLAGFIQTFRSVIPESVVGSVSAPEFETFGAAADLKFKTGTYLGFEANRLASTVGHRVGIFQFDIPNLPILPASTRENLVFYERSAGLTLNQLLGDEWACGAFYRFASAELNTHLVDIPTSILASADDTARSDLHHVGAYVLFNHPTGFFAAGEANWYSQYNTLRTHDSNQAPVKFGLPGDQFAQFNLFIGWRFPRQRGDVSVGVLNLGGGDYHLNPLNLTAELPHERVFTARLRLRF